jgi:hypothetical protein
MQAMPDSKPAQQGLRYLRKVQRPNGGFPLGGSGAVNSQSTAWAVQGILAVGAAPDSIRKGGNSALDYLAARQAADGHYAYSSSSDQTPVWVTGQALAAVAGEPFPVPAAPREPKPAAPAIPSGPSPVPPSSPSPSFPSGSLGQGGTGGFEGGGVTTPGSPPAGGGALPIAPAPGGAIPEGAAPEPVTTAPSGPKFEASEDPGPKPWAPVGVGLASSGIALGSVLLLGRRFGW